MDSKAKAKAGHCFMGLFEEKQSKKLRPNYKLRMVVNWQFLNILSGVGGYFGETKVKENS